MSLVAALTQVRLIWPAPAAVATKLVGGSGSVGWGRSSRLDATLELSHLSVARTLTALGLPAVARGELDGTVHLAAENPALNRLAAVLTGSGSIAVTHGGIDKFNIVEATRNPGKAAVYGGAVDFERLTARIELPQFTAVPLVMDVRECL